MNVYERTILMLDACNLSGLGHDFSKEIIPAIWEEIWRAEGGTKQFNEHPLAVLWRWPHWRHASASAPTVWRRSAKPTQR